jgi:NAD(P)-dependent dehydrogenase (short-subunit alcohol dehydrogenase family)
MPLPSQRFDGLGALVTGAGGGIGGGCATALAEAGARVTLFGRSLEPLERLAAEIEAAGGEATAHPGDVTDPASIEAAIAAVTATAPLSVLVNAAGVNRTGPTYAYEVADWDLLMDVNVRGTFLACRAFARAAAGRTDGGAIVNVSSQMGSVGYPGRAAYCASKHAVDGLTKALAVEWAEDGITVNAVAPTFVETPLTRPMLADPEFAAEVARRIPGGEIASIEDVAAAVVFLASPQARSITGHVLAVDRGWTAW